MKKLIFGTLFGALFLANTCIAEEYTKTSVDISFAVKE